MNIILVSALALGLTLPAITIVVAQQAGVGRNGAPARPEGPCDVYAAGGTPCVAAHSSTRALYAAYNGPLYQVMRQSDGKKLDIGVVQPVASPVPDAGGYADAASQDAFCSNTTCWITTLYDQSGKGNNLVQAPRGGFSGPALGGFNNLPVADMAPVTLMGHRVYGVFIVPGMGIRLNDAHGTAVDDQSEGQYWVINGHHYNNGCCFDYGNAETDSRDDGNGTMETTYYGNSTGWYRGSGAGPWVMTDQENNLVGCVNPDGSKFCGDLPSIDWRFVTAMADGEPHHWRSMGGDAQKGELKVMFDGKRVNNSYDPMRKQGAILLGNGGDNSNGSQGTFYEGAMTAANTFPTADVNQKLQANIVAAHYDRPRLAIAPASAVATPPGLQTFSPGSAHDTAVSFTNTGSTPASGVELSVALPPGWKATVNGSGDGSKKFADPVAPGATVTATFSVTAGPQAFNGDLVANAAWTDGSGGPARSEKAAEKVRSVSPITINEYAAGSGSPANPSNGFIELFNAGDREVDLSGWTLTHHATQQAIFSNVKVPAGTKVAGKGFYLFGLANSGLAVPAKKGDTVIHVRSVTGMNVGDTIDIDGETHKVASLGTAAGNHTTLWQPLPDGPVLTIPVGSTSVPVTNVNGFTVGEKIGLGFGASYPAVANDVEKYEVVTVSAIGKPGTQAWLSANAKAGDTNIKVSSTGNITAGDTIRLDIDSVGHGTETVTVKTVGTQSQRGPGGGNAGNPGTGLELAEPLKFDHAANIPFSSRGTGLTVEPATTVPHSSNEPVQPLGTGITLDGPLTGDHAINAAVRDASVTSAGYQGSAKPNQWFGGPAISAAAGAIVLRDADGRVVDSVNYGGVIDPWAAEGFHETGGAGRGGCSAPAPARGGFRPPPAGGAEANAGPNLSVGRVTDGADTDSNCDDFVTQTVSTLGADAAANATNIKVVSVAGLSVGQKLTIDTGDNAETATIAAVGTPGATTVRTAIQAGATVVPVANAFGFTPGQTITIDAGDKQETALIASVDGGRGGGPNRGNGPTASITLTKPLVGAHDTNAQVAGSGITFSGPLTKAHHGGTSMASGVPTPGAANAFQRRDP